MTEGYSCEGDGLSQEQQRNTRNDGHNRANEKIPFDFQWRIKVPLISIGLKCDYSLDCA